MKTNQLQSLSEIFSVGYHDDLHSDPAVNFQLNRWLSYLGTECFDEIQELSGKLTDFKSYSDEFIKLGDKAQNNSQLLKAAFYYRSAEFFMFTDNPKKQMIRNKFLVLIREYYKLNQRLNQIPFVHNNKKVSLHSYRFTPTNSLDTIVIFGGSDSYIEEFLPILIPLSESGIDIILFEGPGQGCVLEDYKVPLIPDWHLPLKSILDYYNLDDISLMGISAGGLLAMRAAAYEKRVKRVIAFDVLLKGEVWTEKMSPLAGILLKLLLFLRSKKLINAIFNRKMKNNMQLEWGVKHAAHIYGGSTAYDYLLGAQQFSTEDISKDITQDVLLLAGQEDFGVPIRHFYRQIEILKNVRSLTARLFTRAEQAQNHCQVGNLGLALDTILNWIISVKNKNVTDEILHKKNQ